MTGVHPEFDPKASTCSSCAAFESMEDENDEGVCRRRSPVQRTDSCIWPLVPKDVFCCEWLPRPAPLGDWDKLQSRGLGVRASRACWLAKKQGLDMAVEARTGWRSLAAMPNIGTTTIAEIDAHYAEMRRGL